MPAQPPPKPKECGKLSKELLQQYAVNNTVMITFTDHGMFNMYGETWLHNVRQAGISYWVLAAQDRRTADLLVSKGATQCFMGEEIEVDNLHAGEVGALERLGGRGAAHKP